MSEPPTELVTLGKLFESNNSISDYEKNALRKVVAENTIVYPLTPAQIDHITKYGPDEKDDEQIAIMKAEYYDQNLVRSSLFDRIKARFSENYLNDTAALLGYSVGTEKLEKAMKDFTIKQVLNHIFKADVNGNDTLFSMEKFRHRPIFCGVNVLYDPVTTAAFNNMHHTKGEYFDKGWKNEYNNAEYLAKSGEYEYRDITFSPKFLGDLQNKAGTPGDADSNELVALFIRNAFSVGISSVDAGGLGAGSELPAQYSRIFINNAQYDPIYDYNTTLLRSKCLRLDPSIKDTENRYKYIENRVVLLEKPALQKENGTEEQAAKIESLKVDHPCIIFAGDTLTNPNPKEGEAKGYELATYTAVPLCSWSYFCNESEYKGTKAVERLAAVNQCGPFTRVIAKGFYSNAISNILQTYTEIDLVLGKYKDEDDNEHTTFGYKSGDKFDWETVDSRLRYAATVEYEKLKNKKHAADKNTVNDMELYESAYYRNADCPAHIKTLFNITSLPLRFAFFRTNSSDVIHIRQYPATPLLGALPMQDDYITQLVPVYRNLDETPTEKTGMKWYINPNDILIKGVSGKFYNVSQQSYVKKNYPATKGDGVMFTYTGHLYTGPEEGTNLPATVEAIHMGVKTGETTVDLGKIDTSLQYKTDPITIAPNNYLQYMVDPGSRNAATASRAAYREFIKQGCVWRDSDGNEPKKNADIPDTDPIGIDLLIYADIEKTAGKTHSKAPAPDPEDGEVNKTSLTIAIVVLVVLVALIVIFIIYRVIKKKKAAAMGIAQGLLCGD